MAEEHTSLENNSINNYADRVRLEKIERFRLELQDIKENEVKLEALKKELPRVLEVVKGYKDSLLKKEVLIEKERLKTELNEYRIKELDALEMRIEEVYKEEDSRLDLELNESLRGYISILNKVQVEELVNNSFEYVEWYEELMNFYRNKYEELETLETELRQLAETLESKYVKYGINKRKTNKTDKNDEYTEYIRNREIGVKKAIEKYLIKVYDSYTKVKRARLFLKEVENDYNSLYELIQKEVEDYLTQVM